MALPPGVPDLLDVGSDAFFPANAGLLLVDNLTGYGSGQAPQWGIFQNGTPVVIADAITNFGYRQDWAVADYPVERGGFESYDKVITPEVVYIGVNVERYDYRRSATNGLGLMIVDVGLLEIREDGITDFKNTK